MQETPADRQPIASHRENSRKKFRSASLRTGAYEFIPVPFLDDWLISRERRKVVQTILKGRGLSFDDDALRILSGGGKSFADRTRSLAKGLVTKPLRKAFRTVFFWLTARNAARNVVSTYFLARFLHHPEITAVCGNQRITNDDARQLATIFEGVSKNIDLKALGETVRKVRTLIEGRAVAEVDRAELKEAIESNAPGFIQEFDALVSARLLAFRS